MSDENVALGGYQRIEGENAVLIRILTALVGLPLFLTILYVGGGYLQAVVVLLVILGLWESRQFLGPRIYWDFLSVSVGSYLFLSLSQGSFEFVGPWLVVSILYYLIRAGLCGQGAMVGAGHLLVVVYVAVLFPFLWYLRDTFGFSWVLYALIVTWLTDTGAFVFGTHFGRHPLAPRLSPKKTVEGALGGIGAAVLGAAVFALMSGRPLLLLLLLAACLSVCGQIGDLVESSLKRECRLKDSGQLLPGHGGILDRFDSLLFVLPLLYFSLHYLSF